MTPFYDPATRTFTIWCRQTVGTLALGALLALVVFPILMVLGQ